MSRRLAPCSTWGGPRRGTGFAYALVTVRITVTEGASHRLIRLEGRLCSDAWAELEQAIGDDLSTACLDLSGLRGADAVALDGLRRLRVWGVALLQVPPHLAWRIEDDEA